MAAILETLTEAIERLKKAGYTEDFNLKQNCLVCVGSKFDLFHDEFEVDEVVRFEGPTDPGDEAILYAISSKKHGIKGLLVNGYGIYSEPITNEMAQKLRMH